MPQFSLRLALAVTAVLAFFSYAAVSRSTWPATLVIGAVTVALTASLLAALFAKGPDRVFFIGASLVGWLIHLEFRGNLVRTPLTSLPIEVIGGLEDLMPLPNHGLNALGEASCVLAALAAGWFSRWVYQRYHQDDVSP